MARLLLQAVALPQRFGGLRDPVAFPNYPSCRGRALRNPSAVLPTALSGDLLAVRHADERGL
jgi:hypothetical protein